MFEEVLGRLPGLRHQPGRLLMPDAPESIYVSAECQHCGALIIRYRWEDNSGFIHAENGKRSCYARTVATPKETSDANDP